MSMRETFTAGLKEAMKAGDKTRVSTLRMINAAVKDRDIEARGAGKEPIGDAEILAVVQKMIKQVQEALDTAQRAARQDLVDQARAELAVLSSYLPRQMSGEELRSAVSAAIKDTGASGMRDMGKVMAALRQRHAGAMDFAQAGAVVKEQLGG